MFPTNSDCVGRWFSCLAAALSLTSLASFNTAPAQSIWTGNLDDDWSNAANWDNGVPQGHPAFVLDGAIINTSADAPEFARLNLQNGSSLIISHAMIIGRVDDNHSTLIGNGTHGNLRIITGGSLLLPGNGTADLFSLHGIGAVSTATVDGGSLSAVEPTSTFRLGGPVGGPGGVFTLESGSVDIAGTVRLGTSGIYNKGVMNLNGGTFTYGASFVLDGNSGIGPAGGANLNINGATVVGTGSNRVFNVAAGTLTGDYGLVTLGSGSLEFGPNTTMTVGPGGSFQAPASTGRFVISGGDFHAPGENTKVFIHSYGSSPVSGSGFPTAASGSFQQSGGTALIAGELRIGRGEPTSTTSGAGVYVHRGGDMTVSNSSGTGLLRVAIKSEMTISGGTVTADAIQVDGGPSPGFVQGLNGTLVGPVNIEGTLSPGLHYFTSSTATGPLHIHGELTFAATAATFFDLTGTTLAPGSFDSILNDGSDGVTFDGALTLRFVGGEYQPGTVALFDNFASYSGDFASVAVTGLTNGEIATFNPADGTLTIMAEPPPLLPGDYNSDGSVDAADYVVWRKSVGADGLPNRGPLIRGPVGAADYDFWRQNFGAVAAASGATAAIPEPAGAVLLVIGGLAAIPIIRRVRSRAATSVKCRWCSPQRIVRR
jgi:hypothetical protein